MKLASLLSDHAVLQRGIPIPVWGWTKANTRVTVTLGENQAQTNAGSDGKFLVRLPPMKEGGPYTLSATGKGASEKASAKDIWIGEVWVASGQSNMEWTLDKIGNEEETAEIAKFKNLRMIKIPNRTLPGVQLDFEAVWKEADDKDSALAFSAVGAHFAKTLSENLGVKVGIIDSSWGGTIVETWTSRETLIRNPDQTARVAGYEADIFYGKFWDRADGKIKDSGTFALPADPGNEGLKKGWASEAFDDSKWDKMNLPSTWTSRGHVFSGIFWFRKTVQIPKKWAGKSISLNIGSVDKQDITYFNGKKVGATGKNFEDIFWNVPRNYKVPGSQVKAGRSVIAVRAYSFMYDGGMIGPASKMNITLEGSSEKPIDISGDWSYTIEHDFGQIIPPAQRPGPGCPNSPYMLFNNMIAPLLPYAIRGAIWYQGESNANRASEYERLLKDLVRDWRFAWGQGDFPFYNVQLANFGAASDADWPRIREAQLKLLEEPNTGVAVATDIGDSLNIHPSNKREVGRRLALWALADVHGKHVAKSGPLYSSMTIEGSTIRLRFSHVCGGLVAKGGALKLFSIADSTRKFVPAKAVIDGDTLIVSSPDVGEPLAVRYAWSNDPKEANLYSKVGLPASPFRTDTW